jgi:hypothetical protein
MHMSIVWALLVLGLGIACFCICSIAPAKEKETDKIVAEEEPEFDLEDGHHALLPPLAP